MLLYCLAASLKLFITIVRLDTRELIIEQSCNVMQMAIPIKLQTTLEKKKY